MCKLAKQILHFSDGGYFFLKIIRQIFAGKRKMSTFALAKQNGALDEWLSLRSAKPSTAVRIRQAPQVVERA